jgi:DNA-binding MarR family transcriptional regulator
MHTDNSEPVSIPKERYDLQILYALRRIVQAINIHSRKLKTEYDITAPQLVTLMALCDLGPMTIARLSKEIHLSASTLVGIIDRLETKELVVRERCKEDRRKILVHPADKGKQFVERAPSPLQETLAKALAGLPEEEQRTIALSLKRVFELMEAGELEETPLMEEVFTGFSAT